MNWRLLQAQVMKTVKLSQSNSLESRVYDVRCVNERCILVMKCLHVSFDPKIVANCGQIKFQRKVS